MGKKEDFIKKSMKAIFQKGESLILGSALLDGDVLGDAQIKIPLKTLNRHGLIAGATGTGKTKTIQVLSEQEVAQQQEEKAAEKEKKKKTV